MRKEGDRERERERQRERDRKRERKREMEKKSLIEEKFRNLMYLFILLNDEFDYLKLLISVVLKTGTSKFQMPLPFSYKI